MINEYIVRDQSKECLPSILNVLNTALVVYVMELTEKAKKKTIRPIVLGNILILFQNFVCVHSADLGDNEIYQISSLASRFIPEKKEEISDKIILARALNLMVLCHALRPTDFIWNTIKTYYPSEIYFNYDVLVLQNLVER